MTKTKVISVANQKFFWLRNSGNTKKLVRGQSKTNADLLEDEEGRTALQTNDAAKIAGRTAATFSGNLIAELVLFAKPKKGTGKVL